MSDNIKNCCRICLDVKRERVSILQDPIIHLHMKTCLSITVLPYDLLPKSICVGCVSQLSEYYNFVLNARCSQEWLQESLEEENKKISDSKALVQPLPDSEYNSDSLLEFLNNTANIEEYLNNLGKEDIPSIVNMLDRNTETAEEANHKTASKKMPSSKKKATPSKSKQNNGEFEIDVLDSDIDIVKGMLLKETYPKSKIQASTKQIDKNAITCFACKIQFSNKQKLTQHLGVCDYALRTCIHCNCIYDSKKQMLQHYFTHNASLPITCSCSEKFDSKENFINHSKWCQLPIKTSDCHYRCKQCGDILKDKLQMYRHVDGHIKKDKNKDCDICSHSFPGDKALLNHKREVHKVDGDHKYRCKVCQFTSGDHKEVYLHVKKHLARKPMRRLCESCGRSFTSNSALLKHSEQHRDKRNSCGQLFDDSVAKDEHMSYCENVICEKCGRSVILSEHSCEIMVT